MVSMMYWLARLCRDGGAMAGVTLGSVKSCYGHTEGTAGLTGALLAVQSLSKQVTAQQLFIDLACPGPPCGRHADLLEFALVQGVAPIMHLRYMNSYVASALGDWSKAHRRTAHIPLQAGPQPAPDLNQPAAGTGSIPPCFLRLCSDLHHWPEDCTDDMLLHACRHKRLWHERR